MREVSKLHKGHEATQARERKLQREVSKLHRLDSAPQMIHEQKMQDIKDSYARREQDNADTARPQVREIMSLETILAASHQS